MQVVTVLGDVAEVTEGRCPFCRTELSSNKPLIFCPNHWCDAYAGWTPEALLRHRFDKKRWEAKKERQRQELAELQAMLDNANDARRREAQEKREEAERQGFCGRCYEQSGWLTKVRHARGCTRRE